MMRQQRSINTEVIQFTSSFQANTLQVLPKEELKKEAQTFLGVTWLCAKATQNSG